MTAAADVLDLLVFTWGVSEDSREVRPPSRRRPGFLAVRVADTRALAG
jgi:acetate kinase